MGQRWKSNMLKIIDKINSFFGYNFINSVSLKIIHDKINKQKKILPKIKNLYRVQEKIKKIDNSQLKKSLNNLLKAYNEKNE